MQLEIIFRGSYTISKGDGLLQAWNLILMMMMVATGSGQGLLLVSLSLVMKTAIIGGGAKAHLVRA